MRRVLSGGNQVTTVSSEQERFLDQGSRLAGVWEGAQRARVPAGAQLRDGRRGAILCAGGADADAHVDLHSWRGLARAAARQCRNETNASA